MNDNKIKTTLNEWLNDLYIKVKTMNDNKIKTTLNEWLNENKLTTNLQRKLLDDLLKQDATTKEKATKPNNWEVAKNLGLKGILNIDDLGNYWIRQKNEESTGIHYYFMLYGRYMENKIDNKGFVFCKFSAEYNWVKQVLPALIRLSKSLGMPKGQKPVYEVGYNEYFNTSKFPKYEFNGIDFLRV